jgi:cation diffusion facilitator family transporter
VPDRGRRSDERGARLSDKASTRSLYRTATRAAVLGLAVNLSLGIIKLVGGIVGQSFALISDAVNSLGDSLSSVVVLAALWYAQQPADKEHPYGHTRAEGVAASNVALLIILSALFVGWEALTRLTGQHEVPPVWTLWIAGANVVIKEGLYHYKRRVGQRTGSAAIIANAWDHRSDALCSLAVLIGLGTVRWAGPDYIWADEVAALVVVAAILWSGIKLFRSSTSELLDPQASSNLVQGIRQTAGEVPGVCAVEKLWVRKTGLEYLADIHIQVQAKLSVAEGHRIGHVVKDRLLQEFTSLRDVLVHLEPYPHLHQEQSISPEP